MALKEASLADSFESVGERWLPFLVHVITDAP